MRIGLVVALGACHFEGPPATLGPPGDASEVDGSPDVDSDGDGVVDSIDNCRTVPNADQHDFDGDHRGDACDLCPHLASDTDPDGDGDGVGDVCDPRPPQPGGRQEYWVAFYDPGDIAAWVNTGGAWTVANGQLAQANNNFALLDSPDKLGDVYFATSVEVVNAGTAEIGFCGADIQPGIQYYCCGVSSGSVRAASAWRNQPQIFDPQPWTGTSDVGARIDIVGTLDATHSTCTFTQGAHLVTSSTLRGPLELGTAVFYTAAAVRYRYAFVVAIGS